MKYHILNYFWYSNLSVFYLLVQLPIDLSHFHQLPFEAFSKTKIAGEKSVCIIHKTKKVLEKNPCYPEKDHRIMRISPRRRSTTLRGILWVQF
jgi:hypothetical protein